MASSKCNFVFPKKIILAAIIPLLAIGLTINYAYADEQHPFLEIIMPSSEKQIIFDTSAISPRAQMLAGLSASQVMCKEGLNLVFKTTNGSPACVKPSTVYKLIETGWISMKSAFAQEPEPETEQVSSKPKTFTTQLDFLPNENERAMYFVARISDGLIPYTELVKSDFFKFTPFKENTPVITPDNPLPLRPSFKILLETLPNMDNLPYYNAIEKYFQTGSPLFETFDLSIDVVTGDDTVLQTWAYRECELENYTVYLQDNVIYKTFTGGKESEIRERSIFSCRALALESPEN